MLEPRTEEPFGLNVGVIVTGKKEVIAVLECPSADCPRFGWKSFVAVSDRKDNFVGSRLVAFCFSEKESNVSSFADFWHPRLFLRVGPVLVFVAVFDRN
jgi:hypothetical protein